jgi:hypothetical protein
VLPAWRLAAPDGPTYKGALKAFERLKAFWGICGTGGVWERTAGIGLWGRHTGAVRLPQKGGN